MWIAVTTGRVHCACQSCVLTISGLCGYALLACRGGRPSDAEGRASALLQVHSVFSYAAHAAPVLGVQGAWLRARARTLWECNQGAYFCNAGCS